MRLRNAARTALAEISVEKEGIKMSMSERAEEILETLWVSLNENKLGSMDLGIAKGELEISELAKAGFIKIVDGRVVPTERGKKEGEKVVRRHRLAERLFADLIDVKKELIHTMSCKFEHLLHDGVEDNICILLGHPRTCPHGRPIPEGDCCRKSRESIGKVISSLTNFEVNQSGKVAYIQTKDNKKLQKLMAMGILPGMGITLIQKYPSYVLQVGHSQFAVDEDLANAVYIRKRS
ncbi:MAG: metal-dependent transcriptional regulator [Elusimicrobiota bacterium]